MIIGTQKVSSSKQATGSAVSATPAAGAASKTPTAIACKICLADVCAPDVYKLKACKCKFCIYCLKDYVEYSIGDANVIIRCPELSCKSKGMLSTSEIRKFSSDRMYLKYQRMKKDHMIELSPTMTFCPRPGCHGICRVFDTNDMAARRHAVRTTAVGCPLCHYKFCALCRNEWHTGVTCDVAASHLPADQVGVPYQSVTEDSIKRCPSCSCPIERTEGCAQVACKRCSHVFCWYCLQSLEKDLFLRHFDNGPCKDHLGFTPASVRRHRLQVAGSVIGIGVALVLTAPLLLIASPFVFCCKSKLLRKSGWRRGRRKSWLDSGDSN